MKIITGYKGESHITPNEIQCENQGAFGTGSYVMNIGSKFAPTLISANELQIADGEGVMQGVHFRVDPGTYDTVTIENGSQGMNRKDLIVCRYTKDAGTGVEQTEWVVIKGTPTSGSATRPSPTAGDIRTGSTIADMSMFEVVLSGVNVTAVNALFSTIKTMSEMQTDISTNANAISTLNSNIGKLDASSAYAGNQNPDNYTVTGAYHIGLASGSSPTGTAIYGILIVWAHSDTIAQIFIRNTGRTYIRAKADTGSAWIAWNLVRWE